MPLPELRVQSGFSTVNPNFPANFSRHFFSESIFMRKHSSGASPGKLTELFLIDQSTEVAGKLNYRWRHRHGQEFPPFAGGGGLHVVM